jgi:hypothetical protein
MLPDGRVSNTKAAANERKIFVVLKIFISKAEKIILLVNIKLLCYLYSYLPDI